MIDWIWTRTAILANVWAFVTVFALALFFAKVLFPLHAKKYPTTTVDGKLVRAVTLDGRFPGYSPGDVEPKFRELGDDGVDAYFSQDWQLDLIFPWVYALLFAIPIVWLGQHTTVPRCLVLFPYLAAVFDYVENLTMMAMIRAWQTSGAVPFALKVVATIGSRGKWICLCLTAAALLWVAGARLTRRTA
jgi:hypothetical protein